MRARGTRDIRTYGGKSWALWTLKQQMGLLTNRTKTETMKTRWCSLKWLALAIGVWVNPRPAEAYYDPSVARWINRDPVAESGFYAVRSVGMESSRGKSFNRPVGVAPEPVNETGPQTSIESFSVQPDARDEKSLYGFVENMPSTLVDPFGEAVGCPFPCPKGFLGWCVMMCARQKKLPAPICYWYQLGGHTYFVWDCGCW